MDGLLLPHASHIRHCPVDVMASFPDLRSCSSYLREGRHWVVLLCERVEALEPGLATSILATSLVLGHIVLPQAEFARFSGMASEANTRGQGRWPPRAREAMSPLCYGMTPPGKACSSIWCLSLQGSGTSMRDICKSNASHVEPLGGGTHWRPRARRT